jgi:hypothetical protein
MTRSPWSLQELEGKGIAMGDPSSWADTPIVAKANGYVRTGGDPQNHVMASRGDTAAKALLPDTPKRILSDVAAGRGLRCHST